MSVYPCLPVYYFVRSLLPCPSVWPSVCLSVCLSILLFLLCLIFHLSVCLSVCLLTVCLTILLLALCLCICMSFVCPVFVYLFILLAPFCFLVRSSVRFPACLSFILTYLGVKTRKYDGRSQMFRFPDFSVCKVHSVSSHPAESRRAFLIESETVARRGRHIRGRTASCYAVFVVYSTVWSRRGLGRTSQSSKPFSQGKLKSSAIGISSQNQPF